MSQKNIEKSFAPAKLILPGTIVSFFFRNAILANVQRNSQPFIHEFEFVDKMFISIEILLTILKICKVHDTRSFHKLAKISSQTVLVEMMRLKMQYFLH